jgi:hypothetical protein
MSGWILNLKNDQNKLLTLVSFQITLHRECPVTSHTFERLLPGMTVAMDLETARPREGFSASSFHALVAMMLRA